MFQLSCTGTIMEDLRVCRLSGENARGVECREYGNSHCQDPNLTLIYLCSVHMQCLQVHACTCVGNEMLLTIEFHPVLWAVVAEIILPHADCPGGGCDFNA